MGLASDWATTGDMAADSAMASVAAIVMPDFNALMMHTARDLFGALEAGLEDETDAIAVAGLGRRLEDLGGLTSLRTVQDSPGWNESPRG
jgi:hypothetical protein